jgi:hypothetical protein
MRVYLIDMDNKGQHKYGFDIWSDKGYVLFNARTKELALAYVTGSGHDLIETLTLDEYNLKDC